ncbi:MAG: DUF2865 domain-containing protein, partial [Pseudolabrys sp.]|nr:DUF2865 domain-containing protein [Pseudolabrys sp.]
QQGGPACQRLEAQLTALDRGNADPQRAEQIRRAEDAMNRQQAEVDRMVAQSRRMGCESSGFFSLFSQTPAQCGPLSGQIQQARSGLERAQNHLEQLYGGTTERAAQRRSLMIALAENGCGPQYRQAAVEQGGGFLERLFTPGGGPLFGPSDQSGSFRTICVRSCDGYYFPISFQTSASRFGDDERTCQRMCPAAEVQLYTYRNPGEEVTQAVSLSGAPYSALPNAFKYRTAVDKTCSCRQAGQSWADAMKSSTSADSTIEQGDIVVTEKQAKQMSQPRDAQGRPVKVGPNTALGNSPVAATASEDAEPPKGKVRAVGPVFVAPRQ